MTDFEDKMAELKARFVGRCPAWLEELGAALEAGDIPAVVAVAHRVSGNAGMFGFPDLSEAAAELETAALDGDAAAVAACGARLRDMLERVTG